MESTSISQPGKSVFAELVRLRPTFPPNASRPSFAINGKDFLKLPLKPEINVIYRLPVTIEFLWLQLEDCLDVKVFFAKVLSIRQDGLKRVEIKEAKFDSSRCVEMESVDYFFIQSERNTDNVLTSSTAEIDPPRYQENAESFSLICQIRGFATTNCVRAGITLPPRPKFFSVVLVQGECYGLAQKPKYDTSYKLPGRAKLLILRFDHSPGTEAFYSRILSVDTDGFEKVEFRKAKLSCDGVFKMESLDYFWICHRDGQDHQTAPTLHEAVSLDGAVSLNPDLSS